MKSLERKPDARNGHVRFDERGVETKRMAGYSDTGNRKGRTQLRPAFTPPRHSSTPQTTRGAAARDFGCGQGGEFRASPQRAVRNESTPATDKRPAARRVFGEKAVWLRCSSVEDPPGIFSFVAPSGLFPENSAPRSFQTGSK